MKVIAIDQSYTRTGVAIINGDHVDDWETWAFRGLKTKIEKRKYIGCALDTLVHHRVIPDAVIVERVRLFSRGNVSMKTILALGGLITKIVDVAAPITVYSVDTRMWKTAVLHHANATKDDAVAFVKDKIGVELDHDTADAICIGLYASLPTAKLQREE